eukprot:423030_1
MSEAQEGLLKTEKSKPSIQSYGEPKSSYSVSNKIIKKSTPQPQGQRFTLDVQYKTPYEDCFDECGGDPRLFVFAVFTVSGLLVGAGACFFSGYIGYGFLCFVPVILIIILALYCGGCCESEGEKWLKYILIINIDLNKLYVIEESTFERWKLTKIIHSLSQIRSISAMWQRKTRGIAETEDAYVVIKLLQNKEVKMNSKSATIVNVKHFVAAVEKYFEQIGDTYRNVAESVNNIDQVLRTMIRSLKSSNNSEYKKKGMKLDYWYEMKKESIINEFIDLLKQTQQIENQWTADQNQYILKMLMLKCETLENIRNNENNNAYESNTDVRCNLVQVEKLCM